MGKLLDIIRTLIPSFENLPSISSISGLGPGWLFGIFGAMALSLFGLSLGRTRAVLSLLSIYVAFVVINLFPYLESIDQIVDAPFDDHWLKIGVFLATYVLIFIVFNFSLLKKRLSATEFSLFGIILISLLQFGFLTSIIFSLLPKELATKWSLNFYNYFATPSALFVWAVAPLPVLLFIKRK